MGGAGQRLGSRRQWKLQHAQQLRGRRESRLDLFHASVPQALHASLVRDVLYLYCRGAVRDRLFHGRRRLENLERGEPANIVLGDEHQAHAWLSVAEALQRFAWPRERAALREITEILAAGNAGDVEDVLRVL